MKQYLDIVRNVLENGTEKLPERKLEGGRKLDNATIGLPNQVFSHNMRDGFPLLTTKKMGLRNIAVELEGFIKGITSKRWYQERKCNIWDEWANPVAIEEFYDNNYTQPYKKELAENEGCCSIDSNAPPQLSSIRKYVAASVDDLGPIYGYQWRKFGQEYSYEVELDPSDPYDKRWFVYDGIRSNADTSKGIYTGYDQLKNIVETLKTHPADRRMVCSAWNPNQMHLMALPPCHFAWVVTVYNNELNLCWVQRSCDLGLGVPYNIASYALLLQLLAFQAGLACGNLTGILIDCHIYKNHINALKEQLTRTPKKLPQLLINNPSHPEGFDIFKWTHRDFATVDYLPHPPIKMDVTV